MFPHVHWRHQGQLLPGEVAGLLRSFVLRAPKAGEQLGGASRLVGRVWTTKYWSLAPSISKVPNSFCSLFVSVVQTIYKFNPKSFTAPLLRRLGPFSLFQALYQQMCLGKREEILEIFESRTGRPGFGMTGKGFLRKKAG